MYNNFVLVVEKTPGYDPVYAVYKDLKCGNGGRINSRM